MNSGGLYSVPRKKSNPTITNPVSPPLATKKLAERRKALHGEEEEANSEEEDRKFVAQAMPDFSEIKGVPAKRIRPITDPVTPSVAKRHRITSSTSKKEMPKPVFKAQPLPKSTFQPSILPRVTQPPTKPDTDVSCSVKPFIPERSTRPLTRVENVLHSNQRAKFKGEKRKRTHLLKVENLQRQTLRGAKEAMEIAEYCSD